MIVLVVVGIVSIIAYMSFDEIHTLMDEDEDISEAAMNVTDDLHSRFPAVFDGIFAMFFVLLWVAILIAGYMIGAKPIFLVLSIILMASLIIAGIFMSNAYEELMEDSDISDYAAEFPITGFVLTHLLEVLLVIGVSLGIVLYARSQIG